ncbi:MAG: zinc-ribbon and DUF3426 domain-containing protein [Gammaproteobacteria bacterium]
MPAGRTQGRLTVYTQCPQCGRNRALTFEELRASHGIVLCEHCSALFDALERINDKPLKEASAAKSRDVPWLREKRQASGFWGWTLLFGIAVLTGQILYFQGQSALRSQSIRPWLEKTCLRLKCSLPVYHSSGEFSVLHSQMTPGENDAFIFEAVIQNQAAFAQRPPKLKLTLQTLTGEVFAGRIFRPEGYSAAPETLIEPGAALDISLDIAPLDTVLGGYNLELI